MTPWFDLYPKIRRRLAHLTDDERRRCLIRHARRCVGGCSYIEYEPDEVDVQVEWSCLLGAALCDALYELRTAGGCPHCGQERGYPLEMVGVSLVVGALFLCRVCAARHRDALGARSLATLADVLQDGAP